jgi:hypothetical protein
MEYILHTIVPSKYIKPYFGVFGHFFLDHLFQLFKVKLFYEELHTINIKKLYIDTDDESYFENVKYAKEFYETIFDEIHTIKDDNYTYLQSGTLLGSPEGSEKGKYRTIYLSKSTLSTRISETILTNGRKVTAINKKAMNDMVNNFIIPKIFKNSTIPEPRPMSVLIIDRKKSPRMLLNYNVLENILKEKGYTCNHMVLDDIPLKTQIQIIREHSIIITPCGSVQVHIAFMNEKTTFIELCEEGFRYPNTAIYGKYFNKNVYNITMPINDRFLNVIPKSNPLFKLFNKSKSYPSVIKCTDKDIDRESAFYEELINLGGFFIHTHPSQNIDVVNYISNISSILGITHMLSPTQINDILHKIGLFWQYPVITEKTFYEQNKADPMYLPVPWATCIDKRINITRLFNILKQLGISKKPYYTCCQHIYFRKLIPVLKALGIKTIYTPHKVIGEDNIDGIELIACPLYAVNIEDPSRNKEFNDVDDIHNTTRDLLYSFIGGYQKGYLTDTRLQIFNMKHPNNTLIRNTGSWHFNNDVYSALQTSAGKVYEEEIHKKKTSEYNKILLRSRYSLCPGGTGPNSIRFWESLAAGSIPILLSDTLDLPGIPTDIPKWSKSIIQIKETELSTLAEVLSKITEENEISMRTNCIKLYKYFKDNYKQ